MVSQNFDEVGLEAVIRGVGIYAANAGKLVTSNKAINSSLKLAAATAAKFQKAIQTAMKVGALAVAAGIAASVFTFANFDKAMTESIAIMGDVSAAMREDMEVAARNVAKTTTFSMSQAAESYFFLASAGLDAFQSIAALPKVATFAQAGMFDMALATDLLTDAQSALGLTVDDTVQNVENMVRVSDVLVKANTLANATVQQFSESLTREAAAALKSMNKDIEEGVAVLAVFADQGVKGQIAGTSLSRIIRLMGSSAVNNAKAFEKLNIQVLDGEDNFRNFADIIEDMENAFNGMSDGQRIAALESLGFQARVQGVILPLIGTSEKIREYEAGLRDAAGITEEIAENQLTSLSAQFSLLKSGIVDLLFTIGKALEPGLRSLVRTIREDVIPWIEIRLPIALEKARQMFEDWKPALIEAAKTVNDVREAVVAFGGWIISHKVALVAAIVAIGVAFLWVSPVGAIAVGLAGIITLTGLLRADIDELGESALRARIKILKLGLAVAKLVDFLQFIPDVDSPFGKFTIDIPDASNKVRDFNAAIRLAESHLFALDGVIGAVDQTMQSLSDALAESEDASIRVTSATGDLTFVLPRQKVEAELLALAWQELADKGPEVENAFEVIAAAARNRILDMQEFRDAVLDIIFVQGILAGQTAAFRVGTLAQRAGEVAEARARWLAAVAEVFAPAAEDGDGGGGAATGVDAVEDAAELIRTAWEAAVLSWINEIAQGIKDGTITVLEAIDFLEQGMINKARFIVDALVEEQLRIATQFEVMAAIIARGFATIADAQRLISIGAIDNALLILRTISGEETELLDRIERARRERFRFAFPTASFEEGGFVPAGQTVKATLHGPEAIIPLASGTKVATQLALKTLSLGQIKIPSISMQEGGFIPAGTVAQATLHGPELVVPLGGNTMALRALTQALQGVQTGGSNEGFRNFGNVNLFADGDADDRAMRNITRALGV